MTTSNHLYTGAAVALTIQKPIVGVFVALGSHFLLDVLPHYGQKSESVIDWFRHRTTWLVEGLNVVGVPLLVYLLWGQPWWVYAAAIAAIAPDLTWIFRYAYYERYGLTASQSLLTRIHSRIQRWERPWGAIIEVLFFAAVVSVLVGLVY
jgi:hypothetical protein